MPVTLKEQIDTRNAALQDLKAAAEKLLKAIESVKDKNGEGSHTLSTLAIDVTNKSSDLTDACAINYPTVTVDETEYDILKPEFMRNGSLVTAEELADDEEMAASMLEENSNILTPSIPVEFNYEPAEPTTEDTMEFTDMTEGAVGWLWDFAGIDTATTQTANYIFAEAGEYTVTLTVEFASGRTKTASQVITVAVPA